MQPVVTRSNSNSATGAYQTAPSQENVARAKLLRQLTELRYEEGGSWYRLPDWARFYIDLSSIVANNAANTRLVVAISVPSRAYVSALLALGVVGSRVITPVYYDVEQLLERLRSLEPNKTLVTIRGKAVKQNGIFQGFRGEGEQIMFGVKTGPSDYRWFPVAEAAKVQVYDGDPARVPDRFSKRQLEQPSNFIQHVLGEERCSNFVSGSRLDCMLVGQQNLLQYEVCNNCFSTVLDTGERIKGELNQLLRVKSLLVPGDCYRSDIASSRTPVAGQTWDQPAVVILDGARGIPNARLAWPSAHWLVVLDRTGSDFNAGVDFLNAEYVKKRVEPSGTVIIPPVPGGVEVMLFEEAKP